MQHIVKHTMDNLGLLMYQIAPVSPLDPAILFSIWTITLPGVVTISSVELLNLRISQLKSEISFNVTIVSHIFVTCTRNEEISVEPWGPVSAVLPFIPLFSFDQVLLIIRIYAT